MGYRISVNRHDGHPGASHITVDSGAATLPGPGIISVYIMNPRRNEVEIVEGLKQIRDYLKDGALDGTNGAAWATNLDERKGGIEQVLAGEIVDGMIAVGVNGQERQLNATLPVSSAIDSILAYAKENRLLVGNQ